MGNGHAATEEGIVEVQKTLREDGGQRPFAAHQSEFKAKIHYIKERATLPYFGRRPAGTPRRNERSACAVNGSFNA